MGYVLTFHSKIDHERASYSISGFASQSSASFYMATRECLRRRVIERTHAQALGASPWPRLYSKRRESCPQHSLSFTCQHANTFESNHVIPIHAQTRTHTNMHTCILTARLVPALTPFSQSSSLNQQTSQEIRRQTCTHTCRPDHEALLLVLDALVSTHPLLPVPQACLPVISRELE